MTTKDYTIDSLLEDYSNTNRCGAGNISTVKEQLSLLGIDTVTEAYDYDYAWDTVNSKLNSAVEDSPGLKNNNWRITYANDVCDFLEFVELTINSNNASEELKDAFERFKLCGIYKNGNTYYNIWKALMHNNIMTIDDLKHKRPSVIKGICSKTSVSNIATFRDFVKYGPDRFNTTVTLDTPISDAIFNYCKLTNARPNTSVVKALRLNGVTTIRDLIKPSTRDLVDRHQLRWENRALLLSAMKYYGLEFGKADNQESVKTEDDVVTLQPDEYYSLVTRDKELHGKYDSLEEAVIVYNAVKSYDIGNKYVNIVKVKTTYESYVIKNK